MKTKWILNTKKIKKDLSSRLDNGYYDSTPDAKDKLSAILEKINNESELSDKDKVTLRLYNYIKLK